MNDMPRLFQAFAVPAIFITATGLLLLSLNVRLMGMVSRLRQYLHEKYRGAKQGRMAEADAYASEIALIERRVEMIRRAFLHTLICLAGTIATCVLLGPGHYWRFAHLLAAVGFLISIVSLLVGPIHYLLEVSVALGSVRDEAAASRFMDLSLDPGSSGERRNPPEI